MKKSPKAKVTVVEGYSGNIWWWELKSSNGVMLLVSKKFTKKYDAIDNFRTLLASFRQIEDGWDKQLIEYEQYR